VVSTFDVDSSTLRLSAIVLSQDGAKKFEAESEAKCETVEDAEKLGQAVATMLVEKGAAEVLPPGTRPITYGCAENPERAK
jgi:hydroxymethylbilane synthase